MNGLNVCPPLAPLNRLVLAIFLLIVSVVSLSNRVLALTPPSFAN